jgi:hypothetical protein
MAGGRIDIRARRRSGRFEHLSDETLVDVKDQHWRLSIAFRPTEQPACGRLQPQGHGGDGIGSFLITLDNRGDRGPLDLPIACGGCVRDGAERNGQQASSVQGGGSHDPYATEI